jgi:hypothetical protein
MNSAAVDRYSSEWSVSDLHRVFLQHGCAIVRGAINLDVLAAVREAISEAYRRTSNVHVYDPQIQAASGGRISAFDLVNGPLLADFRSRVFAGQGHSMESATARRIEGVERRGWQEPLDLHLDSYFHGLNFTLNFWVPFDPCGVDAPTIQFWPLDYRTSRKLSGFRLLPYRQRRPGISPHFPVAELAINPQAMVRPVMAPGDVAILSNWIIHGSYRTPAMTRGRTNIELRYIGPSLNIGGRISIAVGLGSRATAKILRTLAG